MKLGFSLPVAGAWATPENQVRLAREAEALGYHSLWTLQRLLYALEPKNAYLRKQLKRIEAGDPKAERPANEEEEE